MIALVIIPLVFADPQSRKVLIPDESKPSERFAGEDGEGFYSARQALAEHYPNAYSWRYDLNLAERVATCDLPLYGVIPMGDGYAAVYVEHFSAPTDYDNHFEDTPLLTHHADRFMRHGPLSVSH